MSKQLYKLTDIKTGESVICEKVIDEKAEIYYLCSDLSKAIATSIEIYPDIPVIIESQEQVFWEMGKSLFKDIIGTEPNVNHVKDMKTVASLSAGIEHGLKINPHTDTDMCDFAYYVIKNICIGNNYQDMLKEFNAQKPIPLYYE